MMWANCSISGYYYIWNRCLIICQKSFSYRPIHVFPIIYSLKTTASNRSILNSKEFRVLYSTESTNDVSKNATKNDTECVKQKKPKKEMKTYITLLGLDQSVSVTTVEEANKLATRRNFKLVKKLDFDPKTSRAVYQLMTESQYLKEDKEWDDSKTKKEKFIRGDKVVSFSSNISEHDLLTKVKMMKKWLAKCFEVRIVITGDKSSGENIYKTIEKEIGAEGRILQKRAKGADIRFQIIPPKKTEQKRPEVSEKETT